MTARRWALAGLLLALAAFLNFFHLGVPSLWNDEGFSYFGVGGRRRRG